MNKLAVILAFLFLVYPAHAAVLVIQVEPANVGIYSVTPSVGGYEYTAGQTVNLAASSFIQCPVIYQFDHWAGGAAAPYSANTTVVMDSDKTITAVFKIAAPVCGDQCHPNFTMGDLNHDCIVDLGDFAVLASRWMNCTKPECDEVLPPADTLPPVPNPTTLSVTKIVFQSQWYNILRASEVIDPSGVEYQFECVDMPSLVNTTWLNAQNTAGQFDPSGALKVPYKIWVPVSSSSVSHIYRVQTRDQSPARNTGQKSNGINSSGQVILDVTPPSPNPAQWATQPHPSDSDSIQMTAVTARDSEGDGVQYYFECVEDNRFSSGWISSPTYTLDGVPMDQVYMFRVKYRDLSSNYNQTQYSSAISVMMSDLNPPIPNPAQWATPPYQNGVNSIRMVAATAVDPEGNGVQYAFVCSEKTSLNSGWITNPDYTAAEIGLTAGQTYTFRVIYRDQSYNQTEYSSAVSVNLIAIDFDPPTPNPPILNAVRLYIDGQSYDILTAGVVTDPSGVEYQFKCVDNPGLISSAVKVDWINAGNVVSGIYVFNQTYYPNGTAKIPNKIYVPIVGTASHTYQVRTRDQSPAQNTSEWSSPVTVQ